MGNYGTKRTTILGHFTSLSNVCKNDTGRSCDITVEKKLFFKGWQYYISSLHLAEHLSQNWSNHSCVYRSECLLSS